jgi:hypothetical protein
MTYASTTVVGLRMWCDIASVDGRVFMGRSAFRVSEFAVLSDGREVMLLDDRGWFTGSSTLPPELYFAQFTLHDIEKGIYNVLLPDWADAKNPLPPDLAAVEAVGGAQDWELLIRILRDRGIETTSTVLKSVPRRVDISDRLRAQLRDGDE